MGKLFCSRAVTIPEVLFFCNSCIIYYLRLPDISGGAHYLTYWLAFVSFCIHTGHLAPGQRSQALHFHQQLQGRLLSWKNNLAQRLKERALKTMMHLRMIGGSWGRKKGSKRNGRENVNLTKRRNIKRKNERGAMTLINQPNGWHLLFFLVYWCAMCSRWAELPRLNVAAFDTLLAENPNGQGQGMQYILLMHYLKACGLWPCGMYLLAFHLLPTCTILFLSSWKLRRLLW